MTLIMDAFWILLIAALVSLNGSLIGSYLVLRKSTMMGDAISHAVLPGIVISYLITKSLSSLSVIIGATATGFLAIFLIAFINKTAKLQIDASIGIVFTFLFAIGVILISVFTKKVDLDQECVLFGELIYIPLNLWISDSGIVLGPKSLYILTPVLLFNLLFVTLFFKQLNLTTFDENFANTIGMNSKFWNYAILFTTALTTVASFESVGTILIISFLTIPSAVAYLFCTKVKHMILISSFIGLIAVIIGYYLAIILNANIAGCMSTVGGIIFVIAFCLNYYLNVSIPRLEKSYFKE